VLRMKLVGLMWMKLMAIVMKFSERKSTLNH
jgi:hypothetical protein